MNGTSFRLGLGKYLNRNGVIVEIEERKPNDLIGVHFRDNTGRWYFENGKVSLFGDSPEDLVMEYRIVDHNNFFKALDKWRTEQAEKNKFSVEVGCVYRRENGVLSLITRSIENTGLFVDQYGVNYEPTGKEWTGRYIGFDLVEKIGFVGFEAASKLSPKLVSETPMTGERVQTIVSSVLIKQDTHNERAFTIETDESLYRAPEDYSAGITFPNWNLESLKEDIVVERSDTPKSIEEEMADYAAGEPIIQFSEPKCFLTTTDIQNLALYTDKIEQIANRVGLAVEIRLTLLEEGR